MRTKSLTAPPSLARLYAQAAITGPLHLPRRLRRRRLVPDWRGDPHGDPLPDSMYELSGQSIDPGRLAAYQRVCGFRVTDELPPTYLHVLAFPLAMALMVEPAFPFPLIGLVHVANSITVVRQVRAGEKVSFTVRAENLRPHPAGRQLDLVAHASVDDEPVWSGRSTYLRRGKPAGPRSEKAELAEQAGAVAFVRVPENIGRRYAAVSGDRNPIHLHALSAKAFGFPRAIAHGMWLKARTLAALEGRLPESFTVDVAFKTPVLLPSGVAVATDRAPDGWVLEVRAARSGRPHLAGTVQAGTSA
jgi:acyl dehydratase